MNKVRFLISGIAAGALFLAAIGNAQAGPAKPGNKVKHADKNKDGRISAKELKKEREFERKQRSKVDKPWEEKADKNDDGVVDRKEIHQHQTKEYLKDRSDVDKKWEEKADRNDDGKVDAKELHGHRKHVMDKNNDGKVDSTERKAFWVHRRSKVNTGLEKKYDADGDGYVSPEEGREMLKDRLRIINTHGRAKVDSALEKDFDADGDGVIDKDEAAAIRDALEDDG